MFKHKDQRVGVFIDTQNMYYSARNLFKRKVNFKNIVEDAVAGRKLIRATAYVVSTEGGENEPFFEALEKAGIETRRKALIEYTSGHKKGDWDVGLTIDAVQMLDTLDVVVIVSGDGDFQPLANYIQARGRMVEVMAFGKTTSSKLAEMVNDYIDLSENQRRYLIGPKLETRTERPQTTTTSDEKKKSLPKRSTETDVQEEDLEDPSDSFFMELDDSVSDQIESRTRRLEF
ncbi:NYN domain-containing protein [Candidatus Uhrbacteria bacterium]|nr:NYN domain-containing protein [Candidatus Uhrbacteria bacterium]